MFETFLTYHSIYTLELLKNAYDYYAFTIENKVTHMECTYQMEKRNDSYIYIYIHIFGKLEFALT